ncbi:MAG: S-ribosylhomocysteine lyase, partial [Ruminococcus sp.]|nr:S-ribosylhomocysteine lyase [Ruminococcus sp.]
NIYELVVDMCHSILDHEGEIPGARPEECGNYSDQDLEGAKQYIQRYVNDLIENKRFTYPE